MTTPSHRRLDFHYIAMQIGFWAMFAAMCGFIAPLLSSRGFRPNEVGILIAIRCLAGIVSQPLLGGYADRHPEVPLRRIVVISLGISFGASLVYQFVPLGFWGTMVTLSLIGAFEISIYPLMDSLAIQYINAGVPIRYSLGRGLGSLSFAVCCVLLGQQIEFLGWNPPYTPT